MTIEINKARLTKTLGIFSLFFICILTISCEGGVSRSESERKVENDNGFIEVSGKDDDREYECSGFDPDFTTDTSVYSCDGDQLVINR